MSNSTTGATYSWTGPNGFSSSLEDPIVNGVTNLSAGTYTLIVQLNGCQDTAQTQVQIEQPVSLTLSYPGSPFCSNDVIATPINSWIGLGTYSVLPSGLVLNAVSGAIDPVNSAAGSYQVTFTPSGCALPITVTVIIDPPVVVDGIYHD